MMRFRTFMASVAAMYTILAGLMLAVGSPREAAWFALAVVASLALLVIVERTTRGGPDAN